MIKPFFYGTAVLTGLTIISGAVLSAPFSYAANDTVIDEINISIPLACTMTGTGMNTHNATINPGTVNSAIGETDMKIVCNDGDGFAVYAIGYTGDTDGDTNLTSNTLSPAVNIATGTGTSGSSQWAMKLSAQTSPTPTYPISVQNGFNNFHVVPDDYTLVAKRTAATDIGDTAEGSHLFSTYQAYIASDQAADTYTGQVKYVLVHPHDAPAPGACNPAGTTISTIVCMQDITSTNKSTIRASMTEGTQYQLMDSRDNKVYYVSKLADGNVWMTQNLDLDLDSTKTLTSAETDLPSGTTWTPSVSTYTDVNDWEDDMTISESYNPGDYCWSGTIGDSGMLACEQMDNHYHLGNYYNFTAMVAMDNPTPGYYDQSICPAGWKLPGNSYQESGTLGYLVGQYSEGGAAQVIVFDDISVITEEPLYLGLFGQEPSDLGSGGVFGGGGWSGGQMQMTFGITIAITNTPPKGNVITTSGRAYLGHSVRCLVR